ncbi:MAG: hypothetical protein N4P84_08680 [Lactobacillus crispatus]|nr:hypothetical protein [Lactobacillus crispatus]
MEDLTLLSGRQWIVSQEDSSTFEGCRKIPVIEKGKCNRCLMVNIIVVGVLAWDVQMRAIGLLEKTVIILFLMLKTGD